MKERQGNGYRDSLAGHWISPRLAHAESPIISVFAIDDESYKPEKSWFIQRERLLRELGAEPWEAAANKELAIAPSRIPIRGEGSVNRGFVIICPNALRDSEDPKYARSMLMYKLEISLVELAVPLYSISYRTSILSMELPDYTGKLNLVRTDISKVAMRVLERNTPTIGTVRELQRLAGTVAKYRREVMLMVRQQHRHSTLFGSYKTHADRFDNLPILEVELGVPTFRDLIRGYLKNLELVSISESEELANQLAADYDYIESLFRSTSTLTDLQLQSNIRTFTVAVVLFTIVVPTTIALLPAIVAFLRAHGLF